MVVPFAVSFAARAFGRRKNSTGPGPPIPAAPTNSLVPVVALDWRLALLSFELCDHLIRVVLGTYTIPGWA